MDRKIKVLLAKVGLDGHDRGILVITMALRDAGMEVIYTGLHQSPEQVASIALQEAVDVVGISSLVDAHMTFIPKVLEEFKRQKIGAQIILGGFIQPEDIPDLKAMGVREVFGLNTRLDDIVEYIRALAIENAGALS
jgi:methylmalonyl-CoA mutase C-terminal domain/subunit